MLTKTDLLSSSTPVNPEATRNDWANRLAKLFDQAEDGADQAYCLLVIAEELRAGLKEIAPAISDAKELGSRLILLLGYTMPLKTSRASSRRYATRSAVSRRSW